MTFIQRARTRFVDLIGGTRQTIRQIRRYGIGKTMLGIQDRLHRTFSKKAFWLYNRVTPQISLGGQPAKRILPLLKAEGISGVINMREEYNYAAEVGGTGMQYLHLPTRDHTAPTIEHLQQGVSFIEAELGKGGGVYIHCKEGLGRGPSMVAAYFTSIGMTPGEAWDKIRAARPFINPTSTQFERIEQFALLIKQAQEAATKAQEAVSTTPISAP